MSNQQSEQPAAVGATPSPRNTPRTDARRGQAFEFDHALWVVCEDLAVNLETELAAALHRVTELEKERDDVLHEAHCCDDIKLDQPLAGIISDLQSEREAVSAERDAELRERDELRHRLDTMASTMFPIEPAKGDA